VKPDAEKGYSEEEVRDILARAISLEHDKDDRLSFSEIRAAAVEIGISEESVAQAITMIESRKLDSASFVSRIPRFAATGANVGISLAVVSEGVLPFVLGLEVRPFAFLGGIALLMVCGGMAAVRGRKGARLAFLEFQAKNLGLWTGFGIGTFLALRGVSGDLADVLPTMIIGTTSLLWLSPALVAVLSPRGRAAHLSMMRIRRRKVEHAWPAGRCGWRSAVRSGLITC
jgi:hypothetical protein